MERGFVFLDEVLSGVRWDAKYATWDNFTGTPVDGYEVNRIVGSLRPGRCAAGGDDARGRSRLRLAAVGRLPPSTRGGSVPGMVGAARGRTHEGSVLSEHRPGRDVLEWVRRVRSQATAGEAPSTSRSTDWTPANLRRWGDGHDLMDERSHHGATGVPVIHAQNRRSLCSIMEHSGFERTTTNGGTTSLRDEPYPDTYFDFPIS